MFRQILEPMAGIEPATDGLRNRCSTTELHWLRPCRAVGRELPCAAQTEAAVFIVAPQPSVKLLARLSAASEIGDCEVPEIVVECRQIQIILPVAGFFLGLAF